MSAGLKAHSKSKSTGSPSDRRLLVAFELSQSTWKVALATGPGGSVRQREVPAGNIGLVLAEIAAAKRKWRLSSRTPVRSCYEAGRDGFWLHRCLAEHGIENLILDSSSIEVNRRARRAKSDGLDVRKLLGLLLRHAAGEEDAFRIVQVPTPEQEDARQLHRELQTLKEEGTEHVNRIKGLLASLGLTIEIDKHFPQQLKQLRQWDGAPLPSGMVQRLLREFERLQVVNRQVRELCRQRSRAIKRESSPAIEQVKKLLGLRAIGVNGSWLLVQEYFGWRTFANGKQVGSLAGLTPTPYASGEDNYEQGISKAGNRRIRSPDGRAGLELAALPAAERTQSLVRGAVRPRQQPSAADRHRGPGAEAAGAVVEIPANRRAARGRGAVGLGNESQRHGVQPGRGLSELDSATFDSGKEGRHRATNRATGRSDRVKARRSANGTELQIGSLRTGCPRA